MRPEGTGKRGKTDDVGGELSGGVEHFWLLFTNAPIGIAVRDLRSGRSIVNPALERLLGYPAEQLGRMSFEEFTHSEDAARDQSLYEELITGQRNEYGIEKRYITRAGKEVLANLTVSLVRDSAGQPSHAISMVEDITEQRRLHRQLEESQKLEALGRLAGGIAHDFNNLLTAISGYAQLVEEGVPAESDAYADLQRIKGASDRATALTRQLLAYSRRQVLRARPLSLNDVVRGLEQLLAPVLREDIVLQLNLAGDLWSVVGDPGQLEQVIMNLVLNAGDAMPQGGEIVIETSNVDLDEQRTSDHPSMRAGAYVLLTVSDTGVGMDEATQSKIFEPFYTTKRRGHGTGLGLSTVYGITKQSGGHIRVYSEPGRGTTFKVYLPKDDAAAKPVGTAASPTPVIGGTETILVVEDQEQGADLACRVLARYGYATLRATSAGDGLRLLEENETVDLVLTDVMLPEMTGPELVAQMIQRRPALKVLYMSGYTERAVADEGMVPAGAAFVSKPFSADALALAVREVLDAKPDGA